jgi:hypothetical protein
MMIRRLLLVLIFFVGAAADQTQQKHALQSVAVTIDYGQVRPVRTVTVSYGRGMTALGVLKRAAKVRTKKVGRFVFINAIDGVRSEPQKMGWFYSVDGRHADRTASTFILENAHTMRWEYRPDHCLGR